MSEVTQADRDAAEEVRLALYAGAWGVESPASSWSERHPLLQLIAAHRLAHLTPNTDLSKAHASAVLQAVWDEFCATNDAPKNVWNDVSKHLALRAMHQYAAGLRGEVERLREVLQPFADANSRIRADDPDNDRPAIATVADYRRAATALGDTK